MKLAIFDFDGTLFPRQTIPYLMKCYRKMGYSKKAYLQYMAKALTIGLKYKLPFNQSYGKEQFRREVTVYFIQMFNGQDPKVVEQFFTQSIPLIIDDLNPLVVEEVKKAKVAGDQCILLSGCFHGILQGIADYLEMDYVIGTDIHEGKIKEGKLIIDDLDIATGNKKVERLLEMTKDKSIDWANSKAYGDSSYDQNILSLVGKPVAVNPDDNLRTIAQEKGWRILEG